MYQLTSAREEMSLCASDSMVDGSEYGGSISLDLILGRAVCVRCLDAAVGVLSHASAIRIEDVLLPAGVLDGLHAILLDSLDSAISKNGLFLAICKYALDCAVWESIFQKSINDPKNRRKTNKIQK